MTSSINPILAALNSKKQDGGLVDVNMRNSFELFRIQYQPSMQAVPVSLICQCVNVDDEKLLWIDGLSSQSPVMIPLASTRGKKEWLGSFEEYMQTHKDAFEQATCAATENMHPLLLVRATELMLQDGKISADEAIAFVQDQAEELLDLDMACREVFERARSA